MKKKITNLSKFIGMIGATIVLVSITQWFFRFPDSSQLVLGCGVGITFIGFAYIHTWMRKTADDIRDLHKGLGCNVYINRLQTRKW